jgi:L-asparaginase / beta-aspartyl-peptidase
MDASLMEGATRKAGAAAGVQGVKNPILLSRAIMDQTRHVMLTGKGAEAFAREQGLIFEPAEYFILPERIDELKRVREREKAKTGQVPPDSLAPSLLIGTVGAVALDTHGHLAAGTSTGGMVNKRAGRVGDSPIIGAGTFAEDGVAAVSCTGHGEFFIRSAVAYDVAARMKYQGVTVDAAASEVIKRHLPKLGGTGGLIALDAKGNITTPFNTQGMVRGSIRPGGSIQLAIFEE